MKLRIFFMMLIFVLVLINFVQGEEIKIDTHFYADVDNPKVLEDKNIRNLEREIRWYSSQLTNIDHSFYFLDKFDKDIDKFAKSKFMELKLHQEGIPILNLLVLYSLQEKDVKIVYPEGCIYDKDELDKLAKSTAKNMRESEDFKPFVNLVERLQIIGTKKFEEIKDNPILYCPMPQTLDYEIKESKEDIYCKSLFESDEFDSSRLKILVLGKDFETENEFKEAINRYVMREGFQKIEPFKRYTKKGDDGLFYFVYGEYNLKKDLGKHNDREEKNEIGDEISKCSNVFYTIILNNKKKDEDFRSFYSPNLKASFNVLNGGTIMHETGHRFQLSDEYTGIYATSAAINSIFSHFQLSCSESPEDHWKFVLEEIGDYNFKTCSGDDDSYRSSFQSIMRNTYVYNKFNFLSCLFLVREFEKVNSITDKKVNRICRELYDLGELQKPGEISEEDFDYKYCVEESKELDNFDCKKIIIECSKKESMTNTLRICADRKILEVTNEKS